MKLIIETTADGSPTLYREDLDEHYHSVKGAIAESIHVYLESAWRRIALSQPAVRIFEVGFGTGLNAAITAAASLEASISTKYFSVELYPLPSNTTDMIAEGFPENIRKQIIAVNKADWDEDAKINPFFTLHKIRRNLISMNLPERLDAVYFDAFAPEKQPEMWSPEIFRRIYNSMVPGGILTTYCAKGAIRRLLQQTGFLTERLPGPPAGKREILRATKPL